MPKPVFVLLMAETCAHCANFKNKRWPSIKEELVKQNEVDIVELELETQTTKPSNKYHPDLSKYIGWFPTMFLFNGDSWNNHNSELKGVIKNGKLTNNGVENVKSGGKLVDYSQESIISWVNKNLSQNLIFNSESYGNADKIYIPTAGSVRFRQERLED